MPTHEDKKLDKYLISMWDKPLSEKEYELGGLIDHATGGYGNITKKQRWERAKIKALHNLILSEVESYAKSEASKDTANQIFAKLDMIAFPIKLNHNVVLAILPASDVYKAVKYIFGVD